MSTVNLMNDIDNFTSLIYNSGIARLQFMRGGVRLLLVIKNIEQCDKNALCAYH